MCLALGSCPQGVHTTGHNELSPALGICPQGVHTTGHNELCPALYAMLTQVLRHFFSVVTGMSEPSSNTQSRSHEAS